jgi:hypothetical protein
MPDRNPPDETPEQYEAFVQLERALRLELPDYCPPRGVTASLVLHIGLGFLLAAIANPLTIEEHKRDDLTHAIPIFVPAGGRTPPPETPSERLAVLAEKSLPIAPAAPVPINLTAMGLSFASDVQNELPAVVGFQHGMLALLDRENTSIARYVFLPPDWHAQEITMDVTGKLRLRMEPPERWPVFTRIAQEQGIDLKDYIACAIFDTTYSGCLESAIRKAVKDPSQGRPSSALLQFVADRPCGVVALSVTMDSGHSTAK